MIDWKCLLIKKMDIPSSEGEAGEVLNGNEEILEGVQSQAEMAAEQQAVLAELKKLVAVTERGFDQTMNRFDRLEEDEVCWCCFL